MPETAMWLLLVCPGYVGDWPAYCERAGGPTTQIVTEHACKAVIRTMAQNRNMLVWCVSPTGEVLTNVK